MDWLIDWLIWCVLKHGPCFTLIFLYSIFTFQLKRIRNVGHNKKYFYIEVGRQAVTGPGKICLEAENVEAAQKIHDVVSE